MERLSERSLTVEATGWNLAATLFENEQPTTDAPVVLMSGAAAVPHGYYSHFARFLTSRGAAAVLTYDYRGIAGSAGDRKRWPELSMKDWALLDMPAAMDALREVYPDRTLVGMGHSYGGQALGLVGRSNEFRRYATAATMSGYWRDLGTPLAVLLQTRFVGAPLSRVLGNVPAWAGLGEAMPGTIFREWTKWITTPDYFFSDPSLPQTARFADVQTAILSIGLDDDDWANPVSVGSLMGRYVQSEMRELWFPADGPSGSIGHLGLFRRKHRETFWPIIADYLLDGHWGTAQPFGTRSAGT